MFQAFVILDNHELAAEPRHSRREAIVDADRMHQERNGARRVVVIDNDHYAAGSQASVVYDLPAEA